MEDPSSGDLQRSLLPTTHESNEKREHNVRRNKAVVTVDMIIESYVGGFGKAQLLHVAVVALAWAVDAMHTLVAVFSDSQPPWRCVSESSSCTPHSSLCQLDHSQWQWTDGPGATIVSEWGLICSHKFSAGVPASLFFIGCIIGSGVLGPLSDNWLGRKKTLLLSCGIVTACGFLTALAPNIWIYSALRMMSGFGRAGVGTNSLVLSTEPLASRLRGKVGLYGFLFFMVGFGSLPAIAFITRTSWRETYIVISAFSLLYCCILMQFSWESPKWLMLQHREEEALQVLRSMAAWNSGSSIPEDIEVAMETPQGKGNNGRGKWKLLKVGWARKRMALVMAGAAGTGLVYFGLPLNVGNVKSMNPYVSTLVNALMEVPAVAAGSVLLPTTRRRTMVMVVSSACGVCCWVCAGFAKWKWLVMVSEVLGFLGACFVFDVWYIYCMEMFATEVRSGAVGAMRQAIMGGAALAPCVAVLGRGGQSASFALFGSMSFVTAFVSYFLPETLGVHQCETLEEQERQAVVVSDPVLLT